VALKRYNRRWSPLADDYTAGSSVRCHNLVAFNHHNRRRSRPPMSQQQRPGLHQYNGRNSCRRCCTAELVPLAERLHLEAAQFRCHSLVALKRYNRRWSPLADDYTAGSSVRCHTLVAFNHHDRQSSRPPTSQRQGPGLHQYNGRNFCLRCTPNWSRLPNDYISKLLSFDATALWP
jgi:hypothetical protein